MVRVIVMIRRADEMSREDFLRHWCEDHPAFVCRLPGLQRYRQSPAIEHRKSWPYDGMAELWFASVGDVARAFDTEAAKELFAHEDGFLAETTWFIAEDAIDVPVTLETGAGH